MDVFENINIKIAEEVGARKALESQCEFEVKGLKERMVEIDEKMDRTDSHYNDVKKTNLEVLDELRDAEVLVVQLDEADIVSPDVEEQ